MLDRRHRYVLALVTLALLASCKKDEPKQPSAPPPPPEPTGVLVVADPAAEDDAVWWDELGELTRAADPTLAVTPALADGDASRFASAVKDAAPPKIALLALAIANDITPAAPPSANKARFAELLALKAEAKVPEALARTQSAIADAHATCEERSLRCVVVLVPVPLLVDAKTHPAYEAKGYEVAEWMAGATPLMARLVGWLRQEKIAFVDPTPALKGAADTIVFDREKLTWTPAGAKAMAAEVWQELRVQAVLGPVAKMPGKPAPADDAPVTAREGASDEEKRLIEKLNGLKGVRSEMQAVLQELPARKSEAEGLQAELKKIERGLEPAVVAKVLALSKVELDKRGAPEGSLLYRARGLDARLKPLMGKELAEPKDPPEIAQLKQEVLKQQEATAALGAGTAVALRALSVIEQLKIALPMLAKAKAKANEKD